MEELKPCPFCGSNDVGVTKDSITFGHGSYGNTYMVLCADCHASSEKYDTYNDDYKVARGKCVAAWNKRV